MKTSSWVSQGAWIAVMLLALLHGGLYASYLPPWGLFDEQQHVHYIQHLVEYGTVPIVGQTYLSTEIVESLFQTRRWEVFHWPTPTSYDLSGMGVEGYSYEGFQPPLFYILLSPVYMLLPDDILIKVYGLRWFAVFISLLTVWMVGCTVKQLFPQQRLLPYLVCIVLIAMPERTASVSRVNNDVLLEVMATAFIWACTRAVLTGLSVRQSQLIGLFLGLGLLTKSSMVIMVCILPVVLWANRHMSNWKQCWWIGGIPALLLITWWVWTWLYGDPSGWSNFQELMILPAPSLTLSSLVAAMWDLFRHFWLVWWKGAAAGSTFWLNMLWFALVILSVCSSAGLLKLWGSNTTDKQRYVMLAYWSVIIAYGVITLIAYFNPSLPLIRPVICGRFLLPIIMPVVILFSVGLSNTPIRVIGLIMAVAILFVMDILSLFGNLLPYHYYWSAFVINGIPQPYSSMELQDMWALFYPRFLADKPVASQPALLWLLPIYIVVWLAVGIVVKRIDESKSVEISSSGSYIGCS